MLKKSLAKAKFPTDAASWKTFGVIMCLQIAHDLPNALTATMAPTLFIKRLGMPLEYLGLFFLPFVVTAFKWVWAPMVDNYWRASFGRRKSWLAPCTFAVAATYILISLVQPSMDTLYVIIGLIILKQVFYATQEIAADAYVVENVKPDQRGLGSSVVWLGKEFGQIIGSAGLLFVADIYGWSPAFVAAALLFILFNSPALIRKEPPAPEKALQKARDGGGARLGAFLKRRVNLHVLAIVFAVSFSVQMPVTVIGPFLGDKGLTLTEIGIAIGLAASFGAIISLGVASVAITRIGPKRMAIAMLFVGPLAAPGFLWLAASDAPPIIAVIGVIFWATICTAPTRMVLYAARMGWTSDEQVGTDFTFQQSTWFLGYAATGAFSGVLAAQVGWVWFFIVNVLLTLCALVFFIRSYDTIEQQMQKIRNEN
ncbi:MAG: MFS transporter [Pseudomonadota bacterium]